MKKTPKLKTATALVVASIGLLNITGCTNNQYRAAVTAKYSDCEVTVMPTHPTEYIVRKKDGSVWFVFCGNPFSTKPTSESIAFPATNK